MDLDSIPLVAAGPDKNGVTAEVWYFCEARDDWALIPKGYDAVPETDD